MAIKREFTIVDDAGDFVTFRVGDELSTLEIEAGSANNGPFVRVSDDDFAKLRAWLDEVAPR